MPKQMGAKIYNQAQFKAKMNDNYNPIENMIASVDKLKAAADRIDIETMEFGQYQPILTPLDTWPLDQAKAWWRESGKARMDLTAKANTTPVSNDDPVVPLTKCALLDACIRKCFNSEPPIQMTINIEEQQKGSPDQDTHDIKLSWDYDNGSKAPPTRLYLTMVCPYISVFARPPK
jgi:hypothetical protein